MNRSSPTDSATVPWRSRPLQAILASTAILPLGVPMLSPVLPAIRDHFGVGDAGASLVVVAYFLPAVILSPLIGVLIDRAGRRRVMGAALVIWSAAGTAVAAGPAFEIVLSLRLVQGAAAAAVLIVTVTLIGDLFDGVRRNAVIGMNAATLFVGAALAPLVGGVLVEYGWTVPFGAYVVGFPVAVFALYAVAEPARGRPKTGIGYIRGAVAALPTGPAIGLYGSAILVEFATFGAILTALPFVLVGEYRTAPVVVGAVITANLLVSAFVSANNGRLAARVQERRLIGAGFVIIAVGLLSTWFASGPLHFGIAAAVFGGGYGLVFPSVDASINAMAPSSYRAGALSLRNSATFLGRGTGPLLFAFAASGVGYRLVLVVCGAGILVVGVSALALPRRYRRPESAEE
ncbi:MFS transporter [Halosimplex amylolyticum]|uniref:MFS transporter n=1 Tax=Halosimplex amylolyticum TaxID=3396616 RepID=UPI003F564C00